MDYSNNQQKTVFFLRIDVCFFFNSLFYSIQQKVPSKKLQKCHTKRRFFVAYSISNAFFACLDTHAFIYLFIKTVFFLGVYGINSKSNQESRLNNTTHHKCINKTNKKLITQIFLSHIKIKSNIFFCVFVFFLLRNGRKIVTLIESHSQSEKKPNQTYFSQLSTKYYCDFHFLLHRTNDNCGLFVVFNIVSKNFCAHRTANKNKPFGSRQCILAFTSLCVGFFFRLFVDFLR